MKCRIKKIFSSSRTCALRSRLQSERAASRHRGGKRAQDTTYRREGLSHSGVRARRRHPLHAVANSGDMIRRGRGLTKPGRRCQRRVYPNREGDPTSAPRTKSSSIASSPWVTHGMQSSRTCASQACGRCPWRKTKCVLFGRILVDVRGAPAALASRCESNLPWNFSFLPNDTRFGIPYFRWLIQYQSSVGYMMWNAGSDSAGSRAMFY